MASATAQPVLIIGSGLSGLLLAHSLRKASIPVQIFEKDTHSDSRYQGYRIRMGDLGLSALENTLSPELYKRFEETCGTNVKPNGMVDAFTGECSGMGMFARAGGPKEKGADGKQPSGPPVGPAGKSVSSLLSIACSSPLLTFSLCNGMIAERSRPKSTQFHA